MGRDARNGGGGPRGPKLLGVVLAAAVTANGRSSIGP